jgi:hypothetical protein
MVEAASKGAWLASVREDRAPPHLEAGTLRRCLEGCGAVRDDLFLDNPSRRHLSGGLGAQIDRLKV